MAKCLLSFKCGTRESDITVQDPGVRNLLFEGLGLLYQEQALCDITLVAQGCRVLAHKAVLAAVCKYFNVMFTSNFVERKSDCVTLQEIDGPCLKTVVDYLYTGSVRITPENVESLFLASHMLQLQFLQDSCINFMCSHTTDENCIELYQFAALYDLAQLKKRACMTICEHFMKVSSSEDFMKLEAPEICEVLSHDTVSAQSEVTIYEIARKWLNINWPEREKHTVDVLKHIRFTLLDRKYFEEKVACSSFLQKYSALQTVIKQVQYVHQYPNRWQEVPLTVEHRLGSTRSFFPVIAYTAAMGTCRNFCCLRAYIPDEFTTTENSCGLTMYSDWPQLATHDRRSLLSVKSGTSQSKVHVSFIPYEVREMASMRQEREDFSLVTCEGLLYALGGQHRSSLLKSVEALSQSNPNYWRKVPSLPRKTRCLCSVAYKGCIYVFGGEHCSKKGTRKESNKAFCYDPTKEKWQALAPMQQRRMSAACAVQNDKIYVIGGWTVGKKAQKKNQLAPTSTTTTLSSVEIYNPSTDTWRAGPELPMGLSHMGAVKYHGSIMVLGGVTNSRDPNCSVYQLSSDGCKWCPQRPLYDQQNCNFSVSKTSSYVPYVMVGKPGRQYEARPLEHSFYGDISEDSFSSSSSNRSPAWTSEDSDEMYDNEDNDASGIWNF